MSKESREADAFRAAERRKIEKLMETPAGQQVLKDNEEIRDYLSTDWAQLKGKRVILEEYEKACKEYDDQKKGVKGLPGHLFRVVSKFPDKAPIIDLVIIMAIIGAIIHYSPNLLGWIFEKFLKTEGLETAYYYVGAYASVITIVLGVIMLGAGSVVKTFLTAKRKNMPIIPLMTKHNTIDLKVPERSDLDMVKIKRYGSLVPNSEDFITGPQKISMGFAIPEHGFIFNPRKLLKGIPTTIDMVTIEEYYELGAREARAMIADKAAWIRPLIPAIVIIMLIYLMAGPTFHEKMMSMSKEEEFKGKLLVCQTKLVQNGIFDNPGLAPPTSTLPPPERREPDQDTPARGGVGLSR